MFSGKISTRGGGFASVRTTENFGSEIMIPKDTKAVRVVVEGDGQLWKLNLGTSHSMMSGEPTWTHDFHTQEGKRTVALLPLRSFTPQVSPFTSTAHKARHRTHNNSNTLTHKAHTKHKAQSTKHKAHTAHIHTHTHIHTHSHSHSLSLSHTHSHSHSHSHTYTHTQTQTHTHARTHTHIYACITTLPSFVDVSFRYSS